MEIITFLGAMIGIRIWLRVVVNPIEQYSERIEGLSHSVLFGIGFESEESLHPI